VGPEKAESNFRKHRVLFAESLTVFDDPLLLAVEDDEHSVGEQRCRAAARLAVR
jgi:uncharacterized DUF497 family protein